MNRPLRRRTVAGDMRAARRLYERDYNRGWRSGNAATGLDAADRDGRSNNRAWMDGYLDAAAGRTKWHLRDCPDHATCGEA